MNRIAQFFVVLAVSVMKWIRKLGAELCHKIDPFPDDQVIVMEVDEFCHFLKKKEKQALDL